MIIKSMNKDLTKYGYPNQMEYDNPNFNGHQIGIAICIKNNITNKIEENLLSKSLGDDKTRNELLKELLNNDNKIITDIITQCNDENKLVPKTIYYLPYYITNHSRFKPTILYSNVENYLNSYYSIEVELLLVSDNTCRYITVPIETQNVSIFDCINDLFEYEDDLPDNNILNIVKKDNEYILDFYSESGERFDLAFSKLEDFKNLIVSMRLISITTNNTKDTNENS